MPAATATTTRKPFRHAGEAARRAELIAAALDCVASGGLAAATVREIALRAGVTPGLIRHYFPSKDDLVEAAYQALMDRILAATVAAVAAAPDAPRQRLRAFVQATLGAGGMDAATLAAWAGFIGGIHRDPALKAVHARNYLRFRDLLASLIGAARASAGRPLDGQAQRGVAIAVNAMLDGLWLEGGLTPEDFAAGELARIGLAATEALTGLDLGEQNTGTQP